MEIVIEARVGDEVVYAYESSGNVLFSSPEGRSPQMPEVLEHLEGATKWLNEVLSRPKASGMAVVPLPNGRGVEVRV